MPKRGRGKVKVISKWSCIRRKIYLSNLHLSGMFRDTKYLVKIGSRRHSQKLRKEWTREERKKMKFKHNNGDKCHLLLTHVILSSCMKKTHRSLMMFTTPSCRCRVKSLIIRESDTWEIPLWASHLISESKFSYWSSLIGDCVSVWITWVIWQDNACMNTASFPFYSAQHTTLWAAHSLTSLGICKSQWTRIHFTTQHEAVYVSMQLFATMTRRIAVIVLQV